MLAICKKIGKKVGFFKRLRNKVSISTSINIYNTMIKPHFEYGSTILYSSCTEQQIAIVFIRKLKMGEAPEYLLEQMRYVGDVQPYYPRNAIDFRLQRAHTNALQKTLFYKGLRMFNMMPNETKIERNVKVFRSKAVHHIKNILVQSA